MKTKDTIITKIRNIQQAGSINILTEMYLQDQLVIKISLWPEEGTYTNMERDHLEGERRHGKKLLIETVLHLELAIDRR
ncbi:unnamed protein product [Chironomus riparius]|uniref:Uncharacterized protein n=1 Tax=Chironomus riparius TaxID=315576 RepID=A0A9N9S789_9DIPT|nr:unnamed protein product [Chironomus riparius]